MLCPEAGRADPREGGLAPGASSALPEADGSHSVMPQQGWSSSVRAQGSFLDVLVP